MTRNLGVRLRQLRCRAHACALPVALASLAIACGEAKRAAPDASMKAATADTSSPTLGPGEAYLSVPDGRLWYKKSGTGTGTPVILLHGGPGYSSFYLKSLEALGDDRPVIRYDQLGGGRSGPMVDTSQMTIAHFVRELDSLRAALGYEKVHLLGHSWGTILAFEYYRAHPEHVVSLTLASAALDLPTWQRNARRLVRTLPDSAQRAITAAEAARKFDAPGYQQALAEFYGRYVWRHPVEADLDSVMKTANEQVYNYMQGPSEFTITGTLKTYDVTSQLGTIKVPTLYTVGEFDEADPATIRRFGTLTPGATVEVISGAAHITTWDNPDAMVGVVRRFLRRVDARR
ncbi:MAG: proline iminopeptidase-family hydrolase [Gemmatimonadales bacterium]